MLQHELLIFVTAPLALLSAPWMPMWRGIPLAWRRGVLRPLARNWGIIHKLNQVAHVVGSPLFAWFFFIIDLSVWHLPVMYDLTEQYPALHYTEHALFLFTALLFWGQIIPSFPFRPSLGYAGQVVFIFAATLQGNLLDWFIMSATTPIYPYYAALPRTPDMVSAVVDQHFAAGIMMSASLVSFVVVLLTIAGLWLLAEERRTEQLNAQIAAAQASVQQQ
jgi:cytochrome c oxidase assembly factor CtaG